MGRGIAQIIATGGMRVLLFDNNDVAVAAGREFAERMILRAGEKGTITDEEAKGAVARLSVATQLSDLGNSDLVIEAVVEDLDIKRKVFLELEEVVAEGCILATNTSSLSVAAIAAALKHPGRFAGFHFFNPVPLMKVVEVVSGLETTLRTIDTLVAVARRAVRSGAGLGVDRYLGGGGDKVAGELRPADRVALLGLGLVEGDSVIKELDLFLAGGLALDDLLCKASLEAVLHDLLDGVFRLGLRVNGAEEAERKNSGSQRGCEDSGGVLHDFSPLS